MPIIPVPCLRDNYAYLVHREDSTDCVVIDPSEAGPVREEIRRRGLRLRAILCTHHHADHVGGNRELSSEGVEIYGHRVDRHRIPALTAEIVHRTRVLVAGLSFEVLHVPGHTLGACTYVGSGVAFTGDTLFCGGCGRLFEGSAAQMYESLNVTLGELADDTMIYTGHEYTQANLAFALGLEPGNQALVARQADVTARRRTGGYCASSTLGLERATNPFLRCSSPEIRATLDVWDDDPVSVFAKVRLRKDES